MPESVPLMTPESVRVGPLARTVQAAQLLRRTIIHVKVMPSNPTFNSNEAVQLYGVMDTLSGLLSQQSTDPYCMNFCSAISMCNRFVIYSKLVIAFLIKASARILLYQYHQVEDKTGHLEQCHQNFGPTIDSCTTVNNMAKRFNSISAMFDLNSLNFLLPFSVYQAAIIQATDIFQGRNVDGRKIDELLRMLSFFSKRWRIAGTPSLVVYL